MTDEQLCPADMVMLLRSLADITGYVAQVGAVRFDGSSSKGMALASRSLGAHASALVALRTAASGCGKAVPFATSSEYLYHCGKESGAIRFYCTACDSAKESAIRALLPPADAP